jgi:SAM-dependent methyltransferase
LTGYDPSPFYLKIAKKTACEQIPDPKKRPIFIKGDPYGPSKILFKNNQRNFDSIIIMDNSFGYRGESKDIKMFKELLKVAKKGCILLIETENRDWRLANFERVTFFSSKKIEIHTVWKFNFEESVSDGTWMFYEKDRKDESTLRLRLRLQMLMRLYSLHELKQIVEKSGWRYIESYDDIVTLEPFSNGSISTFTVCISE